MASVPQPARPDAILFVEDDLPLRSVLARSLRAHGHPVVEAGSAEEARGTLERGFRPGLVLLDLNLPGATGWDLLRAGPLTAGDAAPVVVVSAIGVSQRRLRELRVAGYLPKPFALETLLEVCDRFLARSSRSGGDLGPSLESLMTSTGPHE